MQRLDWRHWTVSHPPSRVTLSRRQVEGGRREELGAVKELELRTVLIAGELGRNWQLYQLETLTISHAFFTPDIEPLISLLKGQRCLEALHLTSIPASFQAVLQAIGPIQTLQILDIQDCDLADIQWGCLCLHWPALVELHLLGNDIGPRGVIGLFAALPTRLETLKVLDVSGNRLGDAGVGTVCDWVKNRQLQLKKLALRNNFLGNEGCRALAGLLQSQSSLEMLLLASNILADPGADQVLQALCGPPKVVDLSCTHVSCFTLFRALESPYVSSILLDDCALFLPYPTAISHFHSLVSLSLAGTVLGRVALEVLLDGVKSSWGSLKSLDLSRCGLMPDSSSLLAALITGKQRLKELILWGNALGEVGLLGMKDALRTLAALKALDLRGNAIGGYGTIALASLFPDFPRLTCLKLSENNLGNSGVSALSESLHHLQHLRLLHLSKNCFDSTVCAALFQSLLHCPRLSSLHLSHNPLCDLGVLALASVLPRFLELTTLNLSYTLLSNTAMPNLVSAFQSLPVFAHFHCDGNKLNALALQLLQNACPGLSHLSARHNELHSGRESLPWPLASHLDLSYSHISALDTTESERYLETLKLSGSHFSTAALETVLDCCGSHLQVLSLDDDHVKADSLAKLFQRSPFLTHLSLSNMLIDTLDCSWPLLCKSLVWLDLAHINTLSSSTSLRSVLMALPNLRHLAFTHNALSAQDQTETLLALSTLTRLEELEVGNVRNKGNFTISDALLHLTHLKVVKFTGFPGADAKLALSLESCVNLQCFSLRNFSDSGCLQELGRTLQVGAKLQQLDVTGCILGEAQLTALAAGLQHQCALRSFSLANCRGSGAALGKVVWALAKGLRELDLAGNSLECGKELDLTGALGALTVLDKVRLNGMKWTGLDVQKLGAALAGLSSLALDSTEPPSGLFYFLPTLSTLSLCNCNLTDVSFATLFPALRGLRRLQSLDLDFNKLGRASLRLLVELCMERKACISLRGNSLSEADLETASAHLDVGTIWLLEENLVLR